MLVRTLALAVLLSALVLSPLSAQESSVPDDVRALVTRMYLRLTEMQREVDAAEAQIERLQRELHDTRVKKACS